MAGSIPATVLEPKRSTSVGQYERHRGERRVVPPWSPHVPGAIPGGSFMVSVQLSLQSGLWGRDAAFTVREVTSGEGDGIVTGCVSEL